MNTNTPTPHTIPNASKIIARASASILRDTTPRYSSEDRHALRLLAEYWI